MPDYDCPRCGAVLDEYATDDKQEYVCSDCGYVGVPVEHTSESEETESWDEAFERFAERKSGNE
jgi:DNA-directed RNA polymerase subunit M/transcription elongation factor TFIIS